MNKLQMSRSTNFIQYEKFGSWKIVHKLLHTDKCYGINQIPMCDEACTSASSFHDDLDFNRCKATH